MSAKNRKEFLEWHETKVTENYQFDFKREILEYCRSDVDAKKVDAKIS